MTTIGPMIAEFQAQTGKRPSAIVVAPAAALVLAKREELPTQINGIPVQMRLWDESEVAIPGSGVKLGIFVKEGTVLALRACELQ